MFNPKRETKLKQKVRTRISLTDLQAIGLPVEFYDARVEDYHRSKRVRTAVRKYQKFIDARKEKGKGVLLTGPSGAMKGLLAAVIIKRALQKYMTAKYATVESVVTAYKKDWEINEFIDSDYLVIDPLGTDDDTVPGFVAKGVLSLLLIRKRRGLPVILCSTLPLLAEDAEAEDFSIETVFGSQIGDVIARTCVEIRCPEIKMERMIL